MINVVITRINTTMITRQQWMQTWSTLLVFDINQSDTGSAPFYSCAACSSSCNPHNKAEHNIIISSGIPEVSQSVTVTVSHSHSQSAVRGPNCGRPELLLVPARDTKLRHAPPYSYCFLFLFIYPASSHSSTFSSSFTVSFPSLFISFLFSYFPL